MSAINDALRRASSAARYGAPPVTVTPPPAVNLPPLPVPPPPSPSAMVPPPPPPESLGSALPPVIGSAAGLPDVPSFERKPARKRSKLPVIILLILVVGGGGVGGGIYLFKKQKAQIALAKEKPESNSGDVTDKKRPSGILGDEKIVHTTAGKETVTNTASPEPKLTPTVAIAPAPKTNTAVVAAAPAPTPAPPAPVPAPHPVYSNVRFPPLRLQSIFYRPSSPSVMINGKTLFISDEINGVTVADIQPASVTLVLSGQTNVLTLR